MLLYLSFLSISLIASFIPIAKSYKMAHILLGILALFFCFGYMTGSDWRGYETYYSWLSNGNIDAITFEPGYLILTLIASFLGIPFWPFFIALKLCAFCSLLFYLRKYSNENKFLSVTFFLFVFGLYLFIDNPMRNLLAICIIYFSYHFLEERKFLLFFLIVMLATLFHISSILLLLIAPFYPIRISNKKIFLLFIVFNILFVAFYKSIILNFLGTFSFIPLIGKKISLYFLDGDALDNNQILSLGFFIQLIFFLLILYKRSKIESLPYGKLIFWGAVCYFFLYRMASVVSIFYRLQLFLSVFYAVAVCSIFPLLMKKGNKTIYALFLVWYLYFMTYGAITSSYKYVPYTNYISFLFSPELPFEYRSEYNYINTPYDKKSD